MTEIPALHMLPPEGCIAHVFPDLKSALLVSVEQLCDVGCEVVFDQQETRIMYQKQVIMKGWRDITTGLWKVNITQYPAQFIESMIQHKAQQELAKFLHGAASLPALPTYKELVKQKFLATWPGLTVETITKSIRTPNSTMMGHLDQRYQNTKSTKEGSAKKVITVWQEKNH